MLFLLIPIVPYFVQDCDWKLNLPVDVSTRSCFENFSIHFIKQVNIYYSVSPKAAFVVT